MMDKPGAALKTRLRGAVTLHPGWRTVEHRRGRSQSFPDRVLVEREKREGAFGNWDEMYLLFRLGVAIDSAMEDAN